MNQIGRYEVRGELGRGAMGVVYRAYDTVLDRMVALKTHHSTVILDERARQRFANEIKTSSRLQHPNVVTVFDGGLQTDVPFIAMELVEGRTLQQILEERGQLPPDEALRILRPVAAAIDYAHRRKVIHRDLKPGNILVTADGQAKVSDFGTAKALDATGVATTTLIGTPSHMAPEYIVGEAIDGRVDVFALGVVSYQLLTGTLPFNGEDIAQMIYSVVVNEPAPASDVEPSLPGTVDAVIDRALAKNPDDRYGDAETFVRDLEEALSSELPTAEIGAHEAARSRSRAPAWIATASLALLLGSFFAFQYVTPSAEVSAPAPTIASEPPLPLPEPAVAVVPAESDSPEPIRSVSRRKPEAPPIAKKERPKTTHPPTLASLLRNPVGGPNTLRVQSEPHGALVRINGVPRGRAPLELDGLPAGSYQVAAQFTGAPLDTSTVRLQNGSTLTITFRLTR